MKQEGSLLISYLNQEAFLLKITAFTAILCIESELDPHDGNRGGCRLVLPRKNSAIICACCERSLNLRVGDVLSAMESLDVSRIGYYKVDYEECWHKECWPIKGQDSFFRIPRLEFFPTVYDKFGKTVDFFHLREFLTQHNF